MANAQNQGGTQSAGAVGTPGNFWQHLSDLASQLRAKDWQGAIGTFVDVLQHLSQDWNTFQATPAHTFAAAAPGAGGTVQADQCAQQLEQFVQQHRQSFAAGPGAQAGAFPWQQLIPILLAALQAIFARA